MNCDFIDLKQETIICKRVNYENLYFLLYLMGYNGNYSNQFDSIALL